MANPALLHYTNSYSDYIKFLASRTIEYVAKITNCKNNKATKILIEIVKLHKENKSIEEISRLTKIDIKHIKNILQAVDDIRFG